MASENGAAVTCDDLRAALGVLLDVVARRRRYALDGAVSRAPATASERIALERDEEAAVRAAEAALS